MEQNFFHFCKCTQTTFTRDQWSAHCKLHPRQDEPVATSHGFKWNIHDVCINTQNTSVIKTDEAEFEIRTAQRYDGRWVYGWHYHGLMQDASNGGGSPAMYDGEKFDTENDAIKDAIKKMLEHKDLRPKYRVALQTELHKRRVVQLTLF